MVHSCCAMGCPNRQGDKGVSFHRFPADPEQRERWLTATRKKGWRPTSASRLCGAHFVRGRRDRNPLSPDYVPSLFQHTSQHRRQQVLRAMLVFERKKRLVRRRRQRGELDGAVTVATDCLNGRAKEDEKAKQGQATPPPPPPSPPPPPLAELVSPLKAAKSSSKASLWRCVHEEQATKRYADHMSKSHNEFNLQKCSLLTDPCCPYLTTTPDGFTSCSCCGTGIVEVVCPVCMRAAEPHALQQATPAKSACLERLKGWFDKTNDDSWYYRLQSQLHGCDKQYCDLVVWANKNLLIKRYFRNTPFFEAQRLEEEAKKELPGVLKKWIPDDSSPPPPSGLPCCYCDRPADGAVVYCEDVQCEIKTFHLKCLGLTRLPPLGWRCIDCRKTR